MRWIANPNYKNRFTSTQVTALKTALQNIIAGLPASLDRVEVVDIGWELRQRVPAGVDPDSIQGEDVERWLTALGIEVND